MSLSMALALSMVAVPGEAAYPARIFDLSASGLAAGDLDNDGDLDLVCGNSSGLVALLSDGAGSFSIGPTTAAPPASDILLLDLDGDQILDSVALGGGRVEARKGDGAGGFGPPIVLLQTLTAGAPRAADLNEDGRADLVVPRGAPSPANLIFFGIPGGLALPQTLPSPTTGIVRLADVNGDQHVDIVDGGTGVSVWLGDGMGGFASATTIPGVFTLSFDVGDVTDDGVPDVVLLDPFASSQIQVRAGTGTGGLLPPVFLQEFMGSFSLVDFDGDGRQDIAGTDSVEQTAVRLDRRTGPSQFAAPLYLPCMNDALSVLPVDFDGDAVLDLVAGGTHVSLLPASGPGSFEAPLRVDANPLSAAFPGDANGDLWPDLVAVRLGKVVTHLNDGAGGYAGAVETPLAAGATDLRVEDLDLDGDLDALLCGSTAVQVLLGDGTGAFAPAQSFPPPWPAVECGTADFDRDGIPDLGFAGHIAGGPLNTLYTVVVYFGQPGGTLGGPFGVAVDAGLGTLGGLEVGDATGDANADLIAVVNSTARLYAGDGMGGFAPPQTPLPGGVVKVALGDANGDAVPDLAYTSLGSVTVALGSPSGFVSGGSAALPFAREVRFADADGDAAADVLVSGTPDGAVHLFLGDGAGQIQAASSHWIDGSVEPGFLRVFDADRNGRVDLAASGAALTVLENLLPSFFHHFGSGCPGSGGVTPRLDLTGVAKSGGFVTLALDRGLGGATASLFVGTAEANLPLPGGCPLLASPLLPLAFPLPLSGAGPGAGGFSLSGPVPGAVAPGSVFVFQALIPDPGAPFGFSATNGATLLAQ